MSSEEQNKNKEKKEIDWEKYDREAEALIEKYAKLEKQHEEWNKENHDDEEAVKEVNAFIKENGIKSIIVEEKKEGK